MSQDRQPYLNTRQDQPFMFFGAPTVIRSTGETTDNHFFLMEALSMPPGLESPYHVHHKEDEAFYILAGTIAFLCGETWHVAGPGTWVYGPRDIPHGFRVLGTSPAQMLLLCALRGSIIVYQGEELGLPQVDVPFDKLQDPEAITNWPQTLSRDGARTPMPWTAEGASLGFSTGTPWLPPGETHRALAVDRQEANANSTLAFARQCLALRKAHPVLRVGTLQLVEAGPQKLVFDRRDGRPALRCTFNLSNKPAPFRVSGRRVFETGDIGNESLGAYAALIEELE